MPSKHYRATGFEKRTSATKPTQAVDVALESPLISLVQSDAQATKADVERLQRYGQVRTQEVIKAFDTVIEQSNQAIGLHIQERYSGDTSFFDPLTYLDFSGEIGQPLLADVTVEAQPLASK